MRARGKAHGADMAGDADRDLGRAHVGDRGARRRNPFARQIVRLRQARALDQDDGGEACAGRSPPASQALSGMRQMPTWAASRK